MPNTGPTAAGSAAAPLAVVAGASSGIGLELARQFAEHGYDLVVAAEGRGPYNAVYSASKAFLLSLAEVIRYELRDAGVTVMTLQPGATDTPIIAKSDMEDTKLGAGPKTSAADVARAGFDALMAGEEKVVAGSLAEKLQVAAGKLMPDSIKAAALARMTEPGAAGA